MKFFRFLIPFNINKCSVEIQNSFFKWQPTHFFRFLNISSKHLISPCDRPLVTIVDCDF